MLADHQGYEPKAVGRFPHYAGVRQLISSKYADDAGDQKERAGDLVRAA